VTRTGRTVTEATLGGGDGRALIRRFSLGQYTGVVLGLAIVCVYLWVTQPVFMTWGNWENIIRTQAVVAILGIGMTFVVLTGGIDLSIASGTAAAAMILGEAMTHGFHSVPAVVVCVAFGAVLGLVNGLLIGITKIPFFVVTLGTLSIYQSVALLFTQGETISLFGLNRFKPLDHLANNSVGPLPNLLLVCGVLYALGIFVLRYTRYGRSVYAVGSNREAARLTGINVTFVLVSVYTLAGLAAGLSAVVQSGRLTAASPTADPNLMLNVIAAVLIGGTAFTGGDGSLIGTIVGVLFLGVVENGLSLSGVSTFWQGTVSGVILIAAVAIGVLRDYGWRLDLVAGARNSRRRKRRAGPPPQDGA
jgi:ribose transport system permease protein